MKHAHIAVITALAVIVTAFGVAVAGSAAVTATRSTALAPDLATLLDELAQDEMSTVTVTLTTRADLSGLAGLARRARPAAVETALRATAEAAQAPLIGRLEQLARLGEIASYEPFWVFNGIVVSATPAAITEIANRPDVASVRLPPTIEPAGTSAPVEANVTAIGAPELWAAGITGHGVVVATLDTGVYAAHPDLTAGYRGGSNSWFDPYGQHATPFDADGHGTATMSVIVGRDAGGTAIGVAPDAQWIAAKIFDDSGVATAGAIHAALQWVLDPDGDPTTADTPDVVNNSWTNAGSGCDTEFQPDLTALRAAGILPVFAAGNAGPAESSSRSPANLPEAFAVGAVDANEVIAFDSSRGPSACPGDTEFPDLVAPGVDITVADNSGSYWTASGTSIAAPHVAGALALLLDADATLDTDQQEALLVAGATDLGDVGPDPTYGFGRVDVAASYQELGQWFPNEAPVATFTYRTRKGITAFDAGGSFDGDGTIVAYDWDFGDGTIGSGVEVTHQFAVGSSYTVTLTVRDDDGAEATANQTLTFDAKQGGGGSGGGGSGGGGSGGGGGKPRR